MLLYIWINAAFLHKILLSKTVGIFLTLKNYLFICNKLQYVMFYIYIYIYIYILSYA